MIIYKISIPCTITSRRTHIFKPDLFEISVYVEVSKREFLDVVENCAYNIITDEINVIFICNLKNILLSHCISQPRSMLCRKLERNHIEENVPPPDDKDFDYNFPYNRFSTIYFTSMERIFLLYINEDSKRYIKFL